MFRRSYNRCGAAIQECRAYFNYNFAPLLSLPLAATLPPPPVAAVALTATAEGPKKKKQNKSTTSTTAINSTVKGGANVAQSKQKHTLVLDIDETLLHMYTDPETNIFSSETGRQRFDQCAISQEHYADLPKLGAGNPAFPRDVAVQGIAQLQFQTRPYLAEFLTEISDLFEVVFWTAGVPGYAAAMVNAMERQVLRRPTSAFYDMMTCASGPLADPKAPSPHGMHYYALTRTHCIGGNYLKHIPLLGRDPSNVIMLDDNPRSFLFTPRSALLISRFTYSPTDTALLDIMPMLRAVAAADCATAELDHWRDDSYTKLDDFNLNKKLTSRTSIEDGQVPLGHFKPSRSDRPVAAQVFDEKAKQIADADTAKECKQLQSMIPHNLCGWSAYSKK